MSAASSADSNQVPSEVVAAQPAAAQAARTPAIEQPSDLPAVELSAPLLYQILAAEIALQRGEAASAYATLYKAATDSGDPRLARRATEVAIASRATEQALQAVGLWRQLAPGATEAIAAQSALLVAAARYDEAADSYRAQLANSTDIAADLSRVQQILSRAPEPVRGFSMFEKLAQPYSDRADIGFDVRLLVAQAAFQAGLPARAADAARAALRMKPDSERAAILTAQLLLNADTQGALAKGDAKAEPNSGRRSALALLQDFLARNPDMTNARGVYARVLVADQQIDAAQVQFSTLVKRDSRDAESLYALGVLALQKSQRAPARDYFERYLNAIETQATVASTVSSGNEARRDPTPAWLNLARIAEDERDFDRAMSWLLKAEEGSDGFGARLRRALLLGRLKRVDEARQLLDASTPTTDEDSTQLLLTQGQLLRDAGRYRESFALLDEATLGRPSDPALLYDAAMAAEKVDRIDVMEKHLRKVIELRPDYAHAYNALGYTLADRNVRLDEAARLIDKARMLAPDDAFIMDSEGWLYFRMGQLNKARETLERAYRMKPEADVAAHLGEVLWALGERAAAMRVFRDARAKEPDNDTLEVTLKRLELRL